MDTGLGTRGGFVLVVLAGVLLPGLTNHVLSQSGYHALGSAAWAVGYATMAVVLYVGWVRPLDPTGPDSAIREPDDEGTGGDPTGGADTEGTEAEPAEPN
ncbi:MAG: hypothetical protein ACI9CA_002164 [Natronomonas sp.]|jgi:hypothetical protein